MQNMNLNLSQTKELVENSKKESETTGFENIGKFYKHLRKESKKLKLKSIDKEIYMILVEYSFGYMKNIQVELQISNKQLMEECQVSDKTISNSIHRLIESKLIERVKWQHMGPKQNYKYRVMFPKNYNIPYKQIENKEDNFKIKNKEIKELL